MQQMGLGSRAALPVPYPYTLIAIADPCVKPSWQDIQCSLSFTCKLNC
jgi:hypothetical protein